MTTPNPQIQRLRDALKAALLLIVELRERSGRSPDPREESARAALADVPAEPTQYTGAPQLDQPWQDRLRALEIGWDNNGAAAISEAAIKTVGSFSVVPCSTGGLQVVAYRDGWEVEIEIEADGTICDAEAKRAVPEPVETRTEWRVTWPGRSSDPYQSQSKAWARLEFCTLDSADVWMESRTVSVTATPWTRKE